MVKHTKKSPKLAKKAPQVLSISGIATAEQIKELRVEMMGADQLIGKMIDEQSKRINDLASSVAKLVCDRADHSRKIDGITKRLDQVAKVQTQPVKQKEFYIANPATYTSKFCVIGDKQSNCYTINRNWFWHVEQAEAHAEELMRRSPGCKELFVVEIRRVVTR